MDYAERVELAKAAYEAYGVSVGGKTDAGLPRPEWADLGDTMRSAWLAATTAAVHELLGKTTEG